MPTQLEAALEYHQRGWSVFPLRHKRFPLVPWKAYQTERATLEQVHAWWTEHPDALIGVALGRVSNLLRVDADGAEAVHRLNELGMPQTATFQSPSGGKGWLLNGMDGAKHLTIWKGKGEHEELKVLSDGQYTVVPPGPGYQWLDESPPAKMPPWLYDRYVELVLQDLVKELRPTLRQPTPKEVDLALQHIPCDDYDLWVQVGMALHTCDDFKAWDEWSKKSPKYDAAATQAKWQSFGGKAAGGLTTRSILYWAEKHGGWRPPNRHEPLTELGNARILARMGDGIIKHSAEWGWMWWDGKRWQIGEKAVVELQKKVLEFRVERAIESLSKHMLHGDKSHDDFTKVAKQKMRIVQLVRGNEDERRIRGARTLAESEPALSCDYRYFDRQPWLLNCVNGTLDLRSGELLAHDSSKLLTQLCPTPYDDNAKCPRWEQFLQEVFAKHPELIPWMQKLCGYALTGLTSEHILPIFHGSGRNGKSTLVKTITTVMGDDYAALAPSGFLVQSRGEQHPTKLVVLYGKRFVADMETDDNAKLDEALVKRLTGGDDMQARRMYEDYWKFVPTHKLCIATNYEPSVKGMDIAIWSRIRLIPFASLFENGDKYLDQKLAAEAPGILRWMVEGCLRWQAEGLGNPAAVQDATAAYKGTQDTVAQFFSDRCEKAPGLKSRKADVTSAYKAWCYANTKEPVNPKAFGQSMLKLGIQSDDKHYLDIKCT